MRVGRRAITSLLVSSAFLVACSSDSGEVDNPGGQSSTTAGYAGSNVAESGGSGGAPEPTTAGGSGGSTGGVTEPAASGGAN